MIWLLGATLRVSAILLVALGLTWLLRRRTASLRHAVLLIAMACAAAMPVLSAFIPQWASHGIALPSALQKVSALADPRTQNDARPESSGIPSTLQLPDETTTTLARESQTIVAERVTSAISAAPPSQPPLQPSRWRPGLARIVAAVYVIYIAGVVISLSLLASGLLQLQWLATHSEPMVDDLWRRQAAMVAKAYGLRRSVRLARNAKASVLATWGVSRPQVLLPARAEDWPEDRIRAVLLHELAHIRRNDWLVQFFADVLRAIYWFNPLVWIACARLRQESERACDDSVIGHGVDGAEYATHLLALARSLMRSTSPTLPAPSMARRSTLKSRITSILDPAISRAPTSRVTVARVALTLLPITWLVAACHIAPSPVRETDARPHQSPARIAVSAPGTAVEADGETISDVIPARLATETSHRTSAPSMTHAGLTPQMVAAGILDFVQGALADETPVPLSTFDYLMQTLHTVQRTSQAVLDDDGRDPAALPAKCTALINALGNAANGADGLASRSDKPRLSAPRLEQLATDLYRKAAELSDVLLPVSAATPIDVATPEQRLAVSVRDLAQESLTDTSFVGRHLHNWLLGELSTLQRAARSVISDDGAEQKTTDMKLYALLSSAQSTTRNAFEISDRANESEETRSKARVLATSLRDITPELGNAIRQHMKANEADHDAGPASENGLRGAATSKSVREVHVLGRNEFISDKGEHIAVVTHFAEPASPLRPQVSIVVSRQGLPIPSDAIEDIHLVADGSEITCRGLRGDDPPIPAASGAMSFGTQGAFRICGLQDNAELQDLETVQFTYLGESYLFHMKP